MIIDPISHDEIVRRVSEDADADEHLETTGQWGERDILPVYSKVALIKAIGDAINLERAECAKIAHGYSVVARNAESFGARVQASKYCRIVAKEIAARAPMSDKTKLESDQ